MENEQTLADANVEQLVELIRSGDDADLAEFVDELDPREAARAVCELTLEDEAELLRRLSPESAADLIDDVPEVDAVEALQAVEPPVAAAIIDQIPSDHRADLVSAMRKPEANAILQAMDPYLADKLAELASYDDDTAGGLMITEVLAFRQFSTVNQVLETLRRDVDRLRQLEVQYAYVIDISRRLVGVLRLRDMLLAAGDRQLSEIMIRNPMSIHVDTELPQLEEFFDDHAFLGVPVINDNRQLLGVVTREAVDERTQTNAASDYRRSMGVVQEEIRTMPVLKRSRLRLSWLSVNILLNVVAASVIAGFQSTLEQVIALAVFLPIISDMSGCSGTQAVAVTMREISLGLISPGEIFRVWRKEISLGLINGAALGGLLGLVGWLYGGNGWLGVVVGLALATNTCVAVLIGSALPLVLKRRGVDPALASGPILTTVTDMCGFFLVLGLATLMLKLLV